MSAFACESCTRTCVRECKLHFTLLWCLNTESLKRRLNLQYTTYGACNNSRQCCVWLSLLQRNRTWMRGISSLLLLSLAMHMQLKQQQRSDSEKRGSATSSLKLGILRLRGCEISLKSFFRYSGRCRKMDLMTSLFVSCS